MRKRLLLTLALAALAAAFAPGGARAQGQTGAAAPAAWSRYTYPGEEFSVELPAMPWVHHTSRVIRNTPYDSDRMRVFGLYSGGVVYMVVSFDRPRSIETDDRFAGYIWNERGLTPKGEVRLGVVTGREYEVGLFSLKGTARLFRTKKHAYLLKAFSNVEGHEQEVERFLNSFALGAQPSGEAVADVGPGRGFNTGGPAAPVSPIDPNLVRGAGGSPGGAGPFSQRDVARKAVLVYKPEPGYTEEARKNKVTGVVRIRAVLSSSGKVMNISVVKGLPEGLTDTAINAARHLLFFPAVKDGREVSQYVVLEYNFNIY